MECSRIPEGDVRCPYCHAALATVALWPCYTCGTTHHEDCAREHGRCTVLGCGAPYRTLAATLAAAARTGTAFSAYDALLRFAVFPIIVVAFVLVTSIRDEVTHAAPLLVAAFFFGVTLWGSLFDRVRRGRET